MDWFSLGVMALIAVSAVLVAWWASHMSRTRGPRIEDRENMDRLEWKHDDVKRGTSPESSGL
ncbi:hypothetical protein L1277_001352 [Okibacterium sp. HSC-33S16]|nr:hypothetical protein [Okibacterium sp. HSC-33S16]